jgi:hypothetical protein
MELLYILSSIDIKSDIRSSFLYEIFILYKKINEISLLINEYPKLIFKTVQIFLFVIMLFCI